MIFLTTDKKQSMKTVTGIEKLLCRKRNRKSWLLKNPRKAGYENSKTM